MEGASSVVAKTLVRVGAWTSKYTRKILPALDEHVLNTKNCFLLSLWYESISSGAQYVNLHKYNWMKKSQKIYRFGSRQMYWLSIIAQLEVAKRHSNNTVHLQKTV